MSSRSLRRIASIVAFAALLTPMTALHAAQSRPQPAPAKAQAPEHHNPLVELVLRALASAGVRIDQSVMIDGNG
ncbi:MAG TPA: hypothetical protein VKY89_04180 [Thermoanaerobaculia bacterium]|jgi:hypothetical protein|nr:hypothetical protein [Thermoanaerobaculia bacterium]